MVDHITIDDRYLLHKATLDLIKLLQERMESSADPVNLNNQLYKRVWRAALKCPGFTPCMKDDVVFICDVDDRTALDLGVAPYAVWWKPLFTIGHKPGIPTDTLMASLCHTLDLMRHMLTLICSGTSPSFVSTWTVRRRMLALPNVLLTTKEMRFQSCLATSTSSLSVLKDGGS
jgi:hypothetical protein